MGNYSSDQKNARFYGLKLSKTTDADIIAWLDSQESVQGYLKTLIRNDMKGDSTMITTTEFVRDLWESDPNGSHTELLDLETARNDLKNFAAEGWELPEDITPESYMEAWNELVRENT